MNLSHGSAANSSLFNLTHSNYVYVSYINGATALPAYTATALGPILYNGSTGSPQRRAVILGVSIAVTTASAAAVSIGIAGGTTTAPTSTTASTLVSSTSLFGKLPTCLTYKAGTVSSAPKMYWPLSNLSTAALTVDQNNSMWIPVDGGIIVPQGSYVALVAGATATTSVLDCAILWAELTG